MLSLWHFAIKKMVLTLNILKIMYFLGLCQLESVCVQVTENKGLPWWLSGKESACQDRRCERCGFSP